MQTYLSLVRTNKHFQEICNKKRSELFFFLRQYQKLSIASSTGLAQKVEQFQQIQNKNRRRFVEEQIIINLKEQYNAVSTEYDEAIFKFRMNIQDKEIYICQQQQAQQSIYGANYYYPSGSKLRGLTLENIYCRKFQKLMKSLSQHRQQIKQQSKAKFEQNKISDIANDCSTQYTLHLDAASNYSQIDGCDKFSNRIQDRVIQKLFEKIDGLNQKKEEATQVLRHYERVLSLVSSQNSELLQKMRQKSMIQSNTNLNLLDPVQGQSQNFQQLDT